jgi:uncharacterized membrane protein YfcA
MGLLISGAAAGAINGLLGAGGGMVLIPLLQRFTTLDKNTIFPSSVCIMLPVCLTSLFFTGPLYTLPWQQAMPWLTGSAAGGILAGLWGRKIPVLWLHRGLGILILWGGIRTLC